MGTTFQLTATARLTDGTMRDVTTTASWESTNPTLATVSAAGMVTVHGNGELDVRATYQAVAGSMHLVVALARTTAALEGVVRGVPPSSQPVAGVRVEVIDGPDTGKFATTDSTGVYKFVGLTTGRLSLRATSDGYQMWAIGNLLLSDSVQLQDVWMFPVPPRDASGAPPTARCEDGSWTWASDPKAGCADHAGVAYTLAPGTDQPSSRR